MQPLPEVRLVLISSDWETPYSGMLPGLIAGHYSRAEIHVDLHRLCRFAGGEFYRTHATGLDLQRKLVHVAGRPAVHFDFLSINTGATPSVDTVPGALEFSVAVKPVDALLARLPEIEARFLAARGRAFRLVTVGGGAGGVELTLSLQYRLHKFARQNGIAPETLECEIISASPTLLPGHNRLVQQRFDRLLRARGIQLRLGQPVVAVTATEVECASGARCAHDALCWATHAAPPPWLRESGLASSDDGFIHINRYLQSPSHNFVFAAGDVATMTETPRPKSGVYAVRQGPPLAINLRHAVAGFNLRSHRPQRTHLSLISTGDEGAIASKGPLVAAGRWVWHWKRRIDESWMSQYRELPSMRDAAADMEFTARMKANLRTTDSPQERPSSHMCCGGCGAKVGSVILHDALKQVTIEPHPSIISGLNTPDDAAVFSPPPGRLLVQSVDFFPALVNDPYLFGRLAANHALNDLYAMGATPMMALATVTLRLAGERIMTEQLAQLLAGAAAELKTHAVALAGGHTAEGLETALGLAVTGSVAFGRFWRKTGLQTGDCLVLTKPLGTGVLFAADAQWRLSARAMGAALEGMLMSNVGAVEVFQRAGVSACTDVSGFGLLGHLREMLAAADLGAELWWNAIPSYPDALELLSQGIESSMAAPNSSSRALLAVAASLNTVNSTKLLFDPQTAGPLLAGVDADQVERVLGELRGMGFVQAICIGKIVPRLPHYLFSLRPDRAE